MARAWHKLCSVADVAAVIVNYRTPDLVSDCIAALPAAIERVVVDNGSGDGSPEKIARSHPDVTIVARETNDGFAAGVNAGFAASSAPLVVVLNPDTQPEPGAIGRLADHLKDAPGAGLAAPELLNADGTPQPSAYRRLPNLAILFVEFCVPIGYALAHAPRLDPYRLPAVAYRHGARAAHVYGACMAIRRVAYDAVGPFDEGYFLYLEETDWQRRLSAADWTVDLVPGARVRHLVRAGSEDAVAPSPHFVTSAYRYFAPRPRSLVRAVMWTGAMSSWWFLRLLGVARSRSRDRARAWRHLADFIREDR